MAFFKAGSVAVLVGVGDVAVTSQAAFLTQFPAVLMGEVSLPLVSGLGEQIIPALVGQIGRLNPWRADEPADILLLPPLAVAVKLLFRLLAGIRHGCTS